MKSTGTALEHVVDSIADQEWLQPVEDSLEWLLSRALEAAGSGRQRIINLLSGTWLGHPLHPVLTDVPLGAWTATMVLDGLEAIGMDSLGPGADATLVVGIAGALVAAPSGLNDWSYTTDRARRIGAVHGLLNLTGLALYLLSLVQRTRGNRGAGRSLALLGATVATAAAYLGGELVSSERLGVDHSPQAEIPSEYRTVLSERDLTEGKPVRVEIDGTPIVLVRQGGRVYALADSCSHLGGPLSEGQLQDGCIVCPWHGSRFALDDGSVLDGPATFGQPCFDVRASGGQIEVRQPQAH